MVEIIASVSGKINTGNYENIDPFFSIKEMIDQKLSDEDKIKRQKELHELCQTNFNEALQKIKNPSQPDNSLNLKKIADAYKEIRWYEHGDEKFPSVTSILGYFAKPFDFPKDELKKLADRGTVIHALCEYYMKQKKWINLEELTFWALEDHDVQLLDAIGTVEAHKLEVDNIDFVGFLENFPLMYLDSEFTVISEEFKYAGRCDLKALYNNKVTLCDYKTGSVYPDKTKKALEQLSAYAKGDGMEDVEQIMVINLNHKVKQGWSKPTISTPDKHWEDFLTKRRQFYKELGS